MLSHGPRGKVRIDYGPVTRDLPDPRYDWMLNHNTGNAKSWGLSISHSERHMLALGPKKPITGAVQYFLNPIGIQHILLSAGELQNGTRVTADNLQASSVNINFTKPGGSAPTVTFPMLQGMGFVTAVYTSAEPLVQSSVFFRSFSPVGQAGGSAKYRAVLEDGTTWLVYATPATALRQLNNTTVSGPPGYNGIIQVAKSPSPNVEELYDASAGTFASTCTYSGSQMDHGILQYGYSWHKEGNISRPLLMFALPHHVDSFDQNTAAAVQQSLRLQTTTKGVATAVLADTWTMIEHTPPDLHFAPYQLERGSVTSLSSNALAFVQQAAQAEVNQDFNCNLGSMYFSGKALAKYAMLVYAVHDLARDPGLAATGLDKLKRQFAVFVENKQVPPLVYNPSWRTIVSTAGLGGDPGADFGNSFCNDHHFHYGYHVYTAAVIAYLDPRWLHEGINKIYVDALVQDFAAPVNDELFPFSRAFDWYHGHSWAKGLFASGDGKDQESTSEDAFASYAVKMWGKVSGDAKMDARGSLMLAIQARSFRHYFLMESDNRIQPPEFIGNKVTGILFENKIDHATYFGANIEYIQGIHMIPLSPVSPLTRSRKFGESSWSRAGSD